MLANHVMQNMPGIKYAYKTVGVENPRENDKKCVFIAEKRIPIA